ncbi:hypothetical protein [Streptomyces sp. NPDC056628]
MSGSSSFVGSLRFRGSPHAHDTMAWLDALVDGPGLARTDPCGHS